MTDEDRHADEVNIAFQMGEDWQRERMKARIDKLEAALREIADDGSKDLFISGRSAQRIARKALEGKDD
jgi:hypothetical protein